MRISLEYGWILLLLIFVIETRTQTKYWPEMPLIKFCMGDEKTACPNSIMKWIYNTKECVRAVGKKCTKDFPNMFQSKAACMNFCHGARCYLPPADYISGRCKNQNAKNHTVWVYYKSKCRSWNYSGCGGSTNNFASKKMCLYHCLNPKYNDAMPKIPP